MLESTYRLPCSCLQREFGPLSDRGLPRNSLSICHPVAVQTKTLTLNLHQICIGQDIYHCRRHYRESRQDCQYTTTIVPGRTPLERFASESSIRRSSCLYPTRSSTSSCHHYHDDTKIGAKCSGKCNAHTPRVSAKLASPKATVRCMV